MADMKRSSEAESILSSIDSKTKLGDLRNIAKGIKVDHELALELWSAGGLMPRLLAILIWDHKRLSEDLLRTLDQDMQAHPLNERTQLMDWLMANQLTKSKRNIALMESWANSPSPLQRRAYWYYQGRLRWTGQTPPDNTAELLSEIESKILEEAPEVQWAMNFLAGWIGVYDQQYRSRCVALGKRTGLYKGEMVSKGCTPNYLPLFIEMEAGKRKL